MLPLICLLRFLFLTPSPQHQIPTEDSEASAENTDTALISVGSSTEHQPQYQPFHLAHHFITCLKARFRIDGISEESSRMHPRFRPFHRLPSFQASSEKQGLQLEDTATDTINSDPPAQDFQTIPTSQEDGSESESTTESNALLPASALKDLRIEIGMLVFQLLATSLSSRFPQLQGVLKHAGEVLPLVITRVSEMRAKGLGMGMKRMAGHTHQPPWRCSPSRRRGVGVA